MLAGGVCGAGLLDALVGRAAWCARGRRPAREIATREPDGSEWSISKLGQAPPPTAAAARPFGSAAAYGRRSQALRFRRLRPLQLGLSVPLPPTAAAARPFGSAAYGRRSQALRFRRRLRPPQPGPVSKPGQAPPAATLNISAYNLRQHFLFYPQCAK